MMRFEISTRARLSALAALLLMVVWPGSSRSQDDTVLFTTAVAPNVLIVVDNSGSMNEIIWHEAFDPEVQPTCQAEEFTPEFRPNGDPWIETFSSDTTQTHCGRTRTIFHDTQVNPEPTRYSRRYLNWLFSPEADGPYTEIVQGNNAFPSSCVGGAPFAKYKQARITVAKRALQDIVCEINQVGSVRFGLATFRANNNNSDPDGGFVRVGVDDFSSNQASDFTSATQAIDANTWTPLAESLFQLYTYFMSRDPANIPFGADGATRFPSYAYRTTTGGSAGGGSFDSGGPPQVPPSPVQFSCQKHFVIIITDGEPSKDDFQTPNSFNTDRGFADVRTGRLFGPDCPSDALCLERIAGFMQTVDFRPDMTGEQVIDTYTVGFLTNETANDLLERTAAAGNGIFFKADTADEIAAAVIEAFTDIIRKSQSFTAATVPAARTSAGGSFFTSVFVPSDKSPFWQGHLRRFQIAGNGDILDRNGECAVDDPAPNQCKSGPFVPGAEPFWDAGEEIPDPAVRTLYTSVPGPSSATRVPFDQSLSAADLDVSFPPLSPYPGSTANNAEGLADEIIATIRGCELGTGVLSGDVDDPTPCVRRPWLLSDIFHSNPVVVARPSSRTFEPSHAEFRQTFFDRKRVIFAGANDGFLHAFDAGDWEAEATPPDYTPGTGRELFGFMPWVSRRTIKNLPIDTGSRDYYFVDGSPSVADVWFHGSPVDTVKTADEWRTVLIGGLRQGGPQYYALDVTDPSASSYPGYLWEFPSENAPDSLKQWFGETWGEPVITRVRVRVGANDNGGRGFERWVAIVTGGYHPSGDPNHPAYSASATEGRIIAMIDIKTGELLAAKTFGTATGQEPNMRFAIASTPAVFDLNANGFADVVYVGDLGGNLWKWNIDRLGEDVVNSAGDVTQPAWPFRRFFTAPTVSFSGTTFYKSIFFPPSATFRNNTLFLGFGTGQRANLNFPGLNNRDDNNRIYVMTDIDPREFAATPFPTLTEADLQDRTNILACQGLSTRGYFVRGENGEKWVTNSDIFGGFFIIGSFIPRESTDPCEIGGLSRLYALRIECGEGLFADPDGGSPSRMLELGSGLPTDPRLSISPVDGGNRLIMNKQEGDLVNIDAPEFDDSGIGLLYWRELNR